MQPSELISSPGVPLAREQEPQCEPGHPGSHQSTPLRGLHLTVQGKSIVCRRTRLCGNGEPRICGSRLQGQQACLKQQSLGVRAVTRPQCGQLMRTSQLDPNPGTAPSFQLQETLAVSPAVRAARAEDPVPTGQPGVFTAVGQCRRCCWSNLNGLHSCLIQDGGKAARMQKQPLLPRMVFCPRT